MTDKLKFQVEEMRASLTPYSSVVGTSASLVDGDGTVVALIMISIPNPCLDYKDHAVPIAERIVALWNTRPREAALEAEIAKLRAQITDPRTVTMTRTRYEEYQAAEERLAAYEGQLTAEEMRERCAVIARAERHNREGSKSFFERGAISMSVHVEDAIRALPTKREEG